MIDILTRLVLVFIILDLSNFSEMNPTNKILFILSFILYIKLLLIK